MSRWMFVSAGLMVVGSVGTYFGTTALQGQTSAPIVYPKELSSYREVVKQALPAVVSLEAKAAPIVHKAPKADGPQRRQLFESPGMPGMSEDMLRRFMEGEMEMPPQRSAGSGFIIDPKGVIVTNFHVVDGAAKVEITLTDGRKFVSKQIVADRKNDLAIVRFDPKGTVPFMEFGDSDAMEIGDRVLAMGAPFGMAGSVSQGIISAKGRSGLSTSLSTYEDYLQTDAAINPGNSGGPLVNLEGRVIGIDTAIKSRSGGFQGVGLAISSNLAKNVVSQLMKDGVVHRGYLGIQVAPLSPEVASLMGLKEAKGVELVQVFEGTPAAKAGLKAGDIISSVAGKAVGDAREVQHVVGSLTLNKPYPVQLTRDGKAQTISVVILQQPEEYGDPVRTVPVNRAPQKAETYPLTDKLGFEVSDLTPETASQLGFAEDTTGAVVTKVDPNGAAYEKLARGMIIKKIGNKAVTSAAQARELLEKGSLEKGILVQVLTSKGALAHIALKAETADK
jgi:serine protease Do